MNIGVQFGTTLGTGGRTRLRFALERAAYTGTPDELNMSHNNNGCGTGHELFALLRGDIKRIHWKRKFTLAGPPEAGWAPMK